MIAAAVVALGMLAQAAAPVASGNPHLAEAIEHLRNLDEQRALEALARARLQPNLPTAELARIHLYEGLAHAGLANGAQAVSSFHAARLLDPSVALPADASPRVREWWAQSRPGSSKEAPVLLTPSTAPPDALSPAPSVATSAPRSVPSWVPWVLASAAVVSAASGAWSGSQAIAHANEANGQNSIGSASLLRSRAEGEALAANVLYGSAVVLGAGAAVLFVVRF